MNSDSDGLKLSFLAGAATGFGAIFAVALMNYCAKREKDVVSFSLALAAGVMISVSVVDLWLPLVFKVGWFSPTLAMLFGGVCFKFLSHLLTKFHFTSLMGSPSSSLSSHLPLHAGTDSSSRLSVIARQRNLRISLTMFLTLTLHNLPEGLAVCLSNSASEKLGLTMAIAVGFHNFPEGLCIAVPYYAATQSKRGAIGLAFLSGLSEPFGGAMGLAFLGPFFRSHPEFLHFSLSMVGGVMICSALFELLPEARSHGRNSMVISGFVVGCVTMLATIWLAG